MVCFFACGICGAPPCLADVSSVSVSDVEFNCVEHNCSNAARRSQFPNLCLLLGQNVKTEMARNLSEREKKRFLVSNTFRVIRRRRLLMQVALNYVVARRLVLTVCPFLFLILSSRNVITRVPYVRSCRRFRRNSGWWDEVWNNYSDKRFKQTFRI